MNRHFIFIVFTILVIEQSFGQTILNRSCPERPVQIGFDVDLYINRPWFSLKRFPVPFIPIDCECGTASYTLDEDDSIRVENCCQRINAQDESADEVRCSIGKAVISFPDQNPLEARLNVSFGRPTDRSNYAIIATDYVNFSIVYDCIDMEDGRSTETFWLLSTAPVLNPTVQNTVDQLIDEYFERDLALTVEHRTDRCDYKIFQKV